MSGLQWRDSVESSLPPPGKVIGSTSFLKDSQSVSPYDWLLSLASKVALAWYSQLRSGVVIQQVTTRRLNLMHPYFLLYPLCLIKHYCVFCF